jgi:toxin ParE1/3/4
LEFNATRSNTGGILAPSQAQFDDQALQRYQATMLQALQGIAVTMIAATSAMSFAKTYAAIHPVHSRRKAGHPPVGRS